MADLSARSGAPASSPTTDPCDLDVAVRVAQRMLATYGQPAYSDAGAVAQAHGALTESLHILLRTLGAEQAEADERDKNRCGRCHQPFDATDTRFDGRARYRDTPWCRQCISRCHESTDAFHVCPICDPSRYGGEGR